jgi:hypothetical protein
MMPVSVLTVAMLVAGVGLVDAVRHRDADMIVVFAALIVLHGVALLRLLRGRRGITLRPDLTSWLRRQSAATGEPVERLADRCVAAYRAGLVHDSEAVP